MISYATSMIGDRLAYRLFHPPRRPHHRKPADHRLASTDHTIRTDDGIALHLWLIPGDGEGTAVVGHGIGLTKSASLRHAALLHELGYHVLLFDHRNHGLSGADRSRTQLAERYSNDLSASLAAASQIWPTSGRLIACGFSFSTFATLHVLRHESTQVDGIICDSGPGIDVDAMLRHFLTKGHLPSPAWISKLQRRPDVVNAFTNAAVTMLETEWPPAPADLASGDTPMLFLTGDRDTVVEPQQMRMLASLYPHAALVELESEHLQGIKTAPEAYARAVSTFLADLPTDRAPLHPPTP